MDIFPLGPEYIRNGSRDQDTSDNFPRGDVVSSAGNCGRIANSRGDFGDMYCVSESLSAGSSSQGNRNFAREVPGLYPVRREMHSFNTFDDTSKWNTLSEKTPRLSLLRGDVHALNTFPQETPKFDRFAQEVLKLNPVARDIPKLNVRAGNSIWASAEEPPRYDMFSRGIFNANTRNGERPRYNTLVQDIPMPSAAHVNMPSYSSLARDMSHANATVKEGQNYNSFAQDMTKLNVIAHEMRKLNAIANDMLKFNTAVAQMQPHVETSDAFPRDMPNLSVIEQEMCKFNAAAEEILRFKTETQEMTDFNIAALLDPIYKPEAEEKPELPTCLNPLCGKKHLISHCDITGPDEARVLTNAFFAKEKAGQKKKRTRSRKNKKPNSS